MNEWIKNGGLGGGLGKDGAQTGVPVTLNRLLCCFIFFIFCPTNVHQLRSAAFLLLLVSAAAVVLSVLYLMLARTFTRVIMHVTLVLTILLNVYVSACPKLALTLTFKTSAACIFYWIVKYYCDVMTLFIILILTFFCLPAAAIIFTILALFSIFTYFGFRSRIPLASLLLQVVMDVSKTHKSVFAVAFTALFFQACLSVYV